MSWWERAKVGDKVVCIDSGEWVCLNGCCASGPSIKDICTITEISAQSDGIWLTLGEWGDADEFECHSFRPIKNTALQVENLKRLCNPDKITRGVIETFDSVSEDAR